MTVTVKHAHVTALPNDASKDVSATAWNEAHTLTGLGTAAEVDTGTSGAKVPLLNTANTWSAQQTFTAAPVFTDQSGTRSALSLGTLATQSGTFASKADGAVSSGDNALVRFDGITGTVLQDSNATLSDTGDLTLVGSVFLPNGQKFAVRDASPNGAHLQSNGLRLGAGTNNVVGWTTGANTGSLDTGLGRSAAGMVEVNNGLTGTFRDLKLRNLLAAGGNGSYVQTPSMTVANLAAAGTAGAGARAFVTDATSATFAAALTGGGANKVPCYSDGTNWFVG